VEEVEYQFDDESLWRLCVLLREEERGELPLVGHPVPSYIEKAERAGLLWIRPRPRGAPGVCVQFSDFGRRVAAGFAKGCAKDAVREIRRSWRHG